MSQTEKNPVIVFAAVEIQKAMTEKDPVAKAQLIESIAYSIAYTMLQRIPVAEKLKARNVDIGELMNYIDGYAKSVISEFAAQFARDKLASGRGNMEFSEVLVKSLEKYIAVLIASYLLD